MGRPVTHRGKFMRLSRILVPIPLLALLSLCACGDGGALAHREPPGAPSDTSGVDRSMPSSVDMGTPAPTPADDAREYTTDHPLEGVWVLVGTRAPGADRIEPPSGDIQRLKYVSARRFASLTLEGDAVVRAIAGSCRLGEDVYEESIENVLPPNDRWMLRREFEFSWRLDGDRWVHEGTMRGPDGTIAVHEIWQRLE